MPGPSLHPVYCQPLPLNHPGLYNRACSLDRVCWTREQGMDCRVTAFESQPDQWQTGFVLEGLFPLLLRPPVARIPHSRSLCRRPCTEVSGLHSESALVLSSHQKSGCLTLPGHKGAAQGMGKGTEELCPVGPTRPL